MVGEGARGGLGAPSGRKDGVQLDQVGTPGGKDLNEVAVLEIAAAAPHHRGVHLPPRSDWPLGAVSAVLQLAAYSALTGTALTVLPPGRASVPAFSTPIWVVPLAAWWIGERPSRSGLVGVILGLAGAFVVASPSLDLGDRQLLSYALLMGAACVCGRFRSSSSEPIASPRALLSSHPGRCWPPREFCCRWLDWSRGRRPRIDRTGAACLAYVGPIATAFAYWAVVEAGRHFPASTISMALLAAPGLGILISALTLGEEIGASLITGATLIGLGIRLATEAPGRARNASGCVDTSPKRI